MGIGLRRSSIGIVKDDRRLSRTLYVCSYNGCIVCGFSVGIMWPGTISISSKKFPMGGTAMFALLAMAGDLGGSMGPGIVGRVTQSAGDNIRVGMGVGLIFPCILLVMLFILYIADKTNRNIGENC